jgi:hypothetical protein
VSKKCIKMAITMSEAIPYLALVAQFWLFFQEP